MLAAMAAAITTPEQPWRTHRHKAATSRRESTRSRGQFQWLLVLASVLLIGCATGTAYQPDADDNLPMKLGRVQQLEQGGVTVHVSIPTDDQASRYFGVPLSDYGIQPIWMRIENASDVDYWLMPIAIDRDYYSADEAA